MQSSNPGRSGGESLPAPTGELPRPQTSLHLAQLLLPGLRLVPLFLTFHLLISLIKCAAVASSSLSTPLTPGKSSNESPHVPLGSSSPSQIPTWRLLLAWPCPPHKGLSGLEYSTRVPLTRENPTVHRRPPDAKESPLPVVRCSSPPFPAKTVPFAGKSLELVTRVKSKRLGAQGRCRALGARGCPSPAIIMQPTPEDSLPTHSLHRRTQVSLRPRLPGLVLQRLVVRSGARVRVPPQPLRRLGRLSAAIMAI